uniref:Uncharacterized protein n=1 Tax=Zooxanthella nutricula TaxID=1333877 RepID=A0A7S2Q9K8_9DINO
MAALGGGDAAVCFSAGVTEQGMCRLIRLQGDSVVVHEAAVVAASSLTRHWVLVPAGLGRALACYQSSEHAGQHRGVCRVVERSDAERRSAPNAAALGAVGDAGALGLGVGPPSVVSEGRTFDLALASLFDDTVLACFADASARDRGTCRVLWGPWVWRASEAHVCGGGDGAAAACVA